jgi:predicted neuraminidase
VEVASGLGPGGLRLPTWNPALFCSPQDAVFLFFRVGPGPASWWGMVMRSGDEGGSWSPARRLPASIFGPTKNKPVCLANGSWLCPSSDEYTPNDWRIHFEISMDQGQTWSRTAMVDKGPLGINAIQPTVLMHRDGRLQALARTRDGFVATTWSSDLGRTWSPLERTSLPNPNAGIDAVTLADERQLLVYNDSTKSSPGSVSGPRYPLDIALSEDGINWRHALTLESSPDATGYAYPAVIQTQDGLVHITYTWHRKMIKYVVVNPGQ